MTMNETSTDPTEWYAPDEFSVGTQIDDQGALVPCLRFRDGDTWHGFRFTEATLLDFADELFTLAHPIATRLRGGDE